MKHSVSLMDKDKQPADPETRKFRLLLTTENGRKEIRDMVDLLEKQGLLTRRAYVPPKGNP